MRYLILLILFLLSQFGWKPPAYPRPTPAPVPTATPRPALPAYVTPPAVRPMWVSRPPQYVGYLCQYPPDARWYRCQQVVTNLQGGGRIVWGYTPKPGA